MLIVSIKEKGRCFVLLKRQSINHPVIKPFLAVPIYVNRFHLFLVPVTSLTATLVRKLPYLPGFINMSNLKTLLGFVKKFFVYEPSPRCSSNPELHWVLLLSVYELISKLSVFGFLDPDPRSGVGSVSGLPCQSWFLRECSYSVSANLHHTTFPLNSSILITVQ